MAALTAELKLNTANFMAGIQKAQASIRTLTTKAIKPLSAATSKLTGLFSGLNSKIGGAVAALTSLTAAAAGIRFSINTIGGFEKALDKVQALSGASADEMARLSEESRRLGAITTFSATQAAEGLGFLALAGFDTTEQLASLEGVLRLAQAGQLELGRAAQITAGIMGGFQIDASESERVADVLAKIQASSMTDVEQLGQAMKFVAPFANSIGMSLEETTAVIGTLGNSFLQSGLAGRGFAGTLGQLMNLAPGAAARLGEFGLSEDDLNPDKTPLLEVFANLSKLDSDMFLKSFGSGNFDVAKILANATKSGDFADLLKKAENAARSATNMSKIMTDNLIGDLQILRSTIEETFLTFGFEGGGLTFMRNFVQDTTKGVMFLREAFKSGVLGEAIKTGLTVAFGGALQFFQTRILKIVAAFQEGIEAVGSASFWGQVAGFMVGIKDLMVSAATNFAATILTGMAKSVEVLLAGVLTIADKLTGVFDLAFGRLSGNGELLDRGKDKMGRSFEDERQRAAKILDSAIEPLRDFSSKTLNSGLDKFGVDVRDARVRLKELVAELLPGKEQEDPRAESRRSRGAIKRAGKLPSLNAGVGGADNLLNSQSFELPTTQSVLRAGGFQGAIDRILGGSANAVIEVEAKKQSTLIEKQNQILAKVEKNTRVNPGLMPKFS